MSDFSQLSLESENSLDFLMLSTMIDGESFCLENLAILASLRMESCLSWTQLRINSGLLEKFCILDSALDSLLLRTGLLLTFLSEENRP